MRDEELKDNARRIMKAALAAVEPGAAVRARLSARPSGLSACGREFAPTGRLILVAAGKASLAMARAAVDILGQRIAEGIVVAPKGYPAEGLRHSRLQLLSASHPVPDADGFDAARRITAAVGSMDEGDLCLFLLSGGSSSLLPYPLPPVSLDAMVETTALLLKSGAEIRELNTVRKHASAIAGGRLAALCRGTIVTLAISDVVGDDLGVIGSGPTVADPTTFKDAIDILARYGLTDRVPSTVSALLAAGSAGRIPESPKSVPARHEAFVIASSSTAVEAAAAEARSLGYAPVVLTTSLSGEAREAGRFMAAVARECRRSGRPAAGPACLIAAGETTVTVRGDGIGGRNQEIALAAAIGLDGETGILLTSFASDGKEGNSEAAGAHASGRTLEAGSRAGLDARTCLARNDAHAFLAAAGELIITGPTGTNVNDVTFALVEANAAAVDFAEVYAREAGPYHELVMHEDFHGDLASAIGEILPLPGATVVELGAGTGRVTRILAAHAAAVLAFDGSAHMLEEAARYLDPAIGRTVTLAVADSRAVPLPDRSADCVVEGWSFGHTVSNAADDWRHAAERLLDETMRLLRPGGTALFIETLGTGLTSPTAPGEILPRFYAWLEAEQRFHHRWIRTDYRFASLEEAHALMDFFFGSVIAPEILPTGEVIVPECTGLWWKRRQD